jgi:hypothetical protein
MEKHKRTPKLNLYSLDCSYYNNTYPSREELLKAIIEEGMDPNYEITKNGKPTGEIAASLIVF